MITWDEVHHGRLAGSRLADKCYHLALRDGDIDVGEDLSAVIVAEADTLELDLVFETSDLLRICNLLDIVLRLHDLVYALHGCETLRDHISGLGELLERVQYTIEDDHVEDECRGVDR